MYFTIDTNPVVPMKARTVPMYRHKVLMWHFLENAVGLHNGVCILPHKGIFDNVPQVSGIGAAVLNAPSAGGEVHNLVFGSLFLLSRHNHHWLHLERFCHTLSLPASIFVILLCFIWWGGRIACMCVAHEAGKDLLGFDVALAAEGFRDGCHVVGVHP
jgi:hypothetical protein